MNKKARSSKLKAQSFESKAKVIIFAGLILIFIWGCGRKGPPVPWDTVVPKRIVDLTAILREERLLLEWTSPKENSDKSTLTDLAKFQVFRSEGTLVGGECRGCGEQAKLIYEMKVDSGDEAKGKKISISFDDVESGKVYGYQVVSINRRGYPSAPSNPVTIYWDNPPQPPKMVRGDRGDKRVDLYWDPVEGATGYNIYRRVEEEGIFPLNPLNTAPLTVAQYADLNVENEKGYVYSVRAVRRVVKTDIEGKGSSGVPVTPTDLIPPDAPVGLVAVPLKNGIELNWRRNREPDLFGYHVYRRRPGEKEFKRLTETPLAKELYLDSRVELEQDYEYAVTAVDNSVRKNESPLSEEVRVKYLY